MELLSFLKQIPLPILVVVAVMILMVTVVLAVQYLKMRGLEGIRKDVYQLILEAEHKFKASGQGKQKLKWVVMQARGLLPKWLQFFITEDVLMKLIEEWFIAVKDLLDDGKLNGIQRHF